MNSENDGENLSFHPAMALTAKETGSKYKETSEGGLAVSLVLC